jgi:shikimate kinase
MKNADHIALLGFMAAGKSTIGKRVARELGLRFVDTDELIVARHGPIQEIFERDGEAQFRAREFEVVRETFDGPPAVVALGGGAVTHEPTRVLIAERALRVFIDVPQSALLARLGRARAIRPMLGGTLDPGHVRALLEQRRPLYREAEIVVDGGRRSQGALAREIAALVQAR